MPTTETEPFFVDTNVLLDATNVRRPRHAAALRLLEGGRELVLSAQIVREYLVVATRPPDVNGFGLEIADALENIAEVRRFVRMLPEEKPLLPALLELLRSTPCEGKAIHDALVVATMRVHRVRTLVTSNPKHFARFGASVRVRDLAPIP
jgi:predicted nucleic acid-binding protein